MAPRVFSVLGLFFGYFVAACSPSTGGGPKASGVEVLPLTPERVSPLGKAVSSTTHELERKLEDCIADLRTEPFPGSEMSDDVSAYNRALREELRFEREADVKRAYLEVIQRFPESRLLPLVYLALGEIAFSVPEQREVAQQAYQQVSRFPAATNPAFGVALWRSAEQALKQGPNEATFAAVTKVLTQPALGACSRELRDAAAREIVPLYFTVGQPRKAAPFFARLAQGSPDFGVVATVRLTRLLLDANRSLDAKSALEGLASERVPPTPSYCVDARVLADELQVDPLRAQIQASCSARQGE